MGRKSSFGQETASRPRPIFSTSASSRSARSVSRERDLERGTPPSHSISSSPPQIIFGSLPRPSGVPADISEDAVSGDEDGDGPSESDRLLSSSYGTPDTNRRAPKRHYSLSGYGATRDGTPVAFQGQVAPLSGSAGESAVGGLKRRTQSVLQIAGMIDNNDAQFEQYRKSDEELKSMKPKVRAFYEEQNDLLDGFAEVDDILHNTTLLTTTGELAPALPVLSADTTERRDAAATRVKVAVNVNFLVNCILLAGKIVVVITSNSMSMIASAVDSAMDWLSTAIIFWTGRVIEHRDWQSQYQYPIGKARMEPMSVVIFAVAMIASFLQVFMESAKKLFEKDLEPAVIPLAGKITMIVTIAVKLVMWLWCRTSENTSVKALAQDAENDIVFNFFSLLFPVVGEWLGWRYLDATGGAVLSLYIIWEWMHTLLDNATKLAGKRASPAEHQRIAYLLTRFSPLVRAIQHLSVYHAGDSFIVECDIVLPAETGLTQAHNLGESIQYSIEQLEGVERAYVHVDVTTNPLSGHLER